MCVLAVLAPFLASAAPPAANEASRMQVQDFYRWYLAHIDDTRPPIENEEIDRYLTPSLKTWRIRAYRRDAFAERADYFLNVQDHDGPGWSRLVVAGDVLGGRSDPHLTPTLGGAERVSECVHVRSVAGTWRISQVDSQEDQGSSRGCRS